MRKVRMLILLTAGLAMTAAMANAGPRLTIPETAFNFGFCAQNSVVTHRFTLISTGDEPLHIMEIRPGCSCTQAPLEKDRLATGESTFVEIKFSTKKYLDRVMKSPVIITNEGPPNKELEIISTIVSNTDSTFPLVIQPFILDVSQKTENTIDRIEFGIRNVSDREIKIDYVSGADAYFDVELPKSVKPGELAKAKLQLTKRVLDMSFSQSFTIQCNDDNGTRYTLPVKRTLGGDYKPSAKK